MSSQESPARTDWLSKFVLMVGVGVGIGLPFGVRDHSALLLMRLPLQRAARDRSPGRSGLKGVSEIAAKGAAPGELAEQAKVIMSLSTRPVDKRLFV